MQFPTLTVILFLLLGFVTPLPVESYPAVASPMLPIRIEAHRGAGRLAAENTRQAFEMAIEFGIDGIEIDIWLSKDKVPIVVHGLLAPHKGFIELENEKQNISEIDAGNLKNYTLKNGEKILTLAETLDICKDKINLNIEFKDWREEVVDRVLDVLLEKKMLKQVSFSSFNHGLRRRLTNETARRKLEPMSFGYIASSLFPRFPNYTMTHPGDTLNVDIRYLEKDPEAWLKHLNQAKEHGLMIKIWFPIIFESEIEYYEELMKIGVNTIITNEPLAALDYFESERLIALLM